MAYKLWKNCSKEEKKAIAQIEAKRDELNELFKKGYISYRAWKYNRTLLRKKVDELERKYNENI